jgi:Arc/MetJ-type ribon-helix-helix transcriptional regulator
MINDPVTESDSQVPAPVPPPAGSRVGDTVDEMASTIRDFVTKVPETINKVVERALNVRDATLLVKLSEPVADSIDKLVTSGVFKSRAEAASFLIEEGIKAQGPLFSRIQAKMEEIEKLRDELRHSLSPGT